MKGGPRAAPWSLPPLRPCPKADSCLLLRVPPGQGVQWENSLSRVLWGLDAAGPFWEAHLEEGAAFLSRLTLDNRCFFSYFCCLGAMLTWPWVGRSSWSELGPAQLCLPGNHVSCRRPSPIAFSPLHALRPPSTCHRQTQYQAWENCAVSSPGLPCFPEREAEFLSPPPATLSQAG